MDRVVDNTPNPFTFSLVTGATPNTVYKSDAVILSGLGTPSTATVSEGVLLVNGVDRGLSAVVVNDDLIQLQLTSPPKYSENVSSVITIGEYATAFVVRTYSASEKFKTIHDQTPLDYVFAPEDFDNRICQLQGGVLSCILAEDANDSSGLGAGDYVYVANFYENTVYRVNPNTRRIVRTLTGFDHPYGIAVTYVENPTSMSGYDEYVAVANTGTNEVCLLNQNGDIAGRLPVSSKPVNLVGFGDNNYFVTLPYENKVLKLRRFAYALSIEATIALPENSKPFAIVTDGTDLWVTLAGSNKVAKIDKDLGNYSLIQVGESPLGIAMDATYLWTANSFDNTFSRIKRTTGEVDSFECGEYPAFVATSGDTVWVATFESGLLQEFDQKTVNYVSQMPIGSFCYGLTVDRNLSIWASTYYPNTPSILAVADTTPLTFSFEDMGEVDFDATVTSSPMQVDGLDAGRSLFLYLPNMFNARFVVNDVEMGREATVYNGDAVAVRFDTPHLFLTDLYVMVTDQSARTFIHARTAPRLYPDPLNMTMVTGAFVRSLHQSNDAVISGLSENYTTEIVADPSPSQGYFILNGRKVTTGNTITVKNGDVISYVIPKLNIHYNEVETVRFSNTRKFSDDWKIATVVLDPVPVTYDYYRYGKKDPNFSSFTTWFAASPQVDDVIVPARPNVPAVTTVYTPKIDVCPPVDLHFVPAQPVVPSVVKTYAPGKPVVPTVAKTYAPGKPVVPSIQKTYAPAQPVVPSVPIVFAPETLLSGVVATAHELLTERHGSTSQSPTTWKAVRDTFASSASTTKDVESAFDATAITWTALSSSTPMEYGTSQRLYGMVTPQAATPAKTVSPSFQNSGPEPIILWLPSGQDRALLVVNGGVAVAPAVEASSGQKASPMTFSLPVAVTTGDADKVFNAFIYYPFQRVDLDFGVHQRWSVAAAPSEYVPLVGRSLAMDGADPAQAFIASAQGVMPSGSALSPLTLLADREAIRQQIVPFFVLSYSDMGATAVKNTYHDWPQYTLLNGTTLKTVGRYVFISGSELNQARWPSRLFLTDAGRPDTAVRLSMHGSFIEGGYSKEVMRETELFGSMAYLPAAQRGYFADMGGYGPVRSSGFDPYPGYFVPFVRPGVQIDGAGVTFVYKPGVLIDSSGATFTYKPGTLIDSNAAHFPFKPPYPTYPSWSVVKFKPPIDLPTTFIHLPVKKPFPLDSIFIHLPVKKPFPLDSSFVHVPQRHAAPITCAGGILVRSSQTHWLYTSYRTQSWAVGMTRAAGSYSSKPHASWKNTTRVFARHPWDAVPVRDIALERPRYISVSADLIIGTKPLQSYDVLSPVLVREEFISVDMGYYKDRNHLQYHTILTPDEMPNYWYECRGLTCLDSGLFVSSEDALAEAVECGYTEDEVTVSQLPGGCWFWTAPTTPCGGGNLSFVGGYIQGG